MAETWFRADDHFGHERVIGMCERPFRDVAHMADELVARHNAVVSPEDTVWFLGDVAHKDIPGGLANIARMNGRKRLVSGNHDLCWVGHRNASDATVALYRDAGFDALYLTPPRLAVGVVPKEVLTGLPGLGQRPVALSHLPHDGDSRPGPQRHPEYRPARQEALGENSWRVCGHVHQAWTVHDRQINVGVDVWDWAPVHSSRIVEIIENGGKS